MLQRFEGRAGVGTAWFAVFNPVAGGGRGAHDIRRIAALLEGQRVGFDLQASERGGHAAELAAEAARAGRRHFLAIGGDGTLHEMVNGVLASGVVAPGEATFGLIPVGRGNDWARTHAIPRQYARAAAVLAAGRSVLHDVGVAQMAASGDGAAQRYFINAAGAGFDAHVVGRTRGRDLGMLSYMAALPASLLTFRAPELEVRSTEATVRGRYFMAFASINRYCGGGMLVAPAAEFDDGLLDVTVLEEISLLDLLLSIKKLYDGTLPSHPKVRTFRSGTLEVGGPVPVGSEADGELIGATPIRFGVLPRHVRVIVP
jgi:YegS/Rv2252/BmrU family lipid kinase